MKTKMIFILALIIKILLIGFITTFLLKNIKPEIKFHEQNIIVWIFLYVPLFMGYESLISTIFKSKKDENHN